MKCSVVVLANKVRECPSREGEKGEEKAAHNMEPKVALSCARARALTDAERKQLSCSDTDPFPHPACAA